MWSKPKNSDSQASFWSNTTSRVLARSRRRGACWLISRRAPSTSGSAPRLSCCRGTIRSWSPSRPPPSICYQMAGSISASARVIALMNFPGFASRPRKPERFDEAIEVIRKAWTAPGRFSHHGKRWHFDNVVVEPSPIQRPHPPLWLGAGSAPSIRRAAREGYNLLLDQIAPTDLIIERVAVFRDECERVGRRWDPLSVGVTRGLQIVHNEEERRRAIAIRRQVLKNIGDLARGPDAERYARIKDDEDAFVLD